MEQLHRYRVCQGLDLFYIPRLVSPTEQARLIAKIQASKAWHTLSNRRLQALPSQLLQGTTLLKQALPGYLQEVIERTLLPLGVFEASLHQRPNHVLINEYQPGQGIHAHEDGPAYYPLVCTITLGSHCVYHLYNKSDRRKVANLVQEPGSLLITCGSTYTDYLHGIDEIEVDQELSEASVVNWSMLSCAYQQSTLPRQTRISLTFRDVLKERALVKLGR